MRVFVSWSKSRGKRVADALRTWLPSMNHHIEPWVSAEIEAGKRWRDKLYQRLEETNVGIICVTPESVNSPWLNFEAGALAKSAQRGVVCPYLFELDPDDDDHHPIRAGPLADYQFAKADYDGTLHLLRTMNGALQKQLRKPEGTLLKDFESSWPQLKRTLGKIRSERGEEHRNQARRLLENIDHGSGPLSTEVQRTLWIPEMLQQIRSRLEARGSRSKPPTLDVFDINALPQLHSGHELFIDVLARGGQVRVVVLDPRSKQFADRARVEGDNVGRIAAEEIASFHIIADLLDYLQRRRKPRRLEVRVTSTLPSGAMILVDVDQPEGAVMFNPYPADDSQEPSTPWFTYTPRDGAAYTQHRDGFNTLWREAVSVTPRSTVGPKTVWPFEERRLRARG
jgi:hypothetical protein